MVLAWGVEHFFKTRGGLPGHLAGLPALCRRVRCGLDDRDKPAVVTLRRLVGLALVVLVMLLTAAFAGRLWGRNQLRLAGFIQRHLDLHGGVGVGVLVRRHHECGHGGRLGA